MALIADKSASSFIFKKAFLQISRCVCYFLPNIKRSGNQTNLNEGSYSNATGILLTKFIERSCLTEIKKNARRDQAKQDRFHFRFALRLSLVLITLKLPDIQSNALRKKQTASRFSFSLSLSSSTFTF